MESLRISLNLSAFTGSTGCTGCTSAGANNINCEGSTPNKNRMENILTGHDFLLMVTNWSNSGNGCTLEFFGGTAIISDPVPPEMIRVEPNCSANAIKVGFSKDVRCTSVTSSGSEFSIQPGGSPLPESVPVVVQGSIQLLN